MAPAVAAVARAGWHSGAWLLAAQFSTGLGRKLRQGGSTAFATSIAEAKANAGSSALAQSIAQAEASGCDSNALANVSDRPVRHHDR